APGTPGFRLVRDPVDIGDHEVEAVPDPGGVRGAGFGEQGVPDLPPASPEARQVLVLDHVMIAQEGGEVGDILMDQSDGRLPEQGFVSCAERCSAPGTT